MIKNKEYYYDYYKKLIESRGWKMISTEYIDRNKTLKMLCDKEHPVSQRPRDIKNNIGCKQCKKLTDPYLLSKFEYYKKFIEENGGEMISDTYVNYLTPIKYKCKN